ncbi:MAG: family 1 extracellular solute-binding protein [Paenibacillus sp.]|nr:family 1 extracellular solute-binding protein [Paenibacillus sp.]
MVQLNRWLGYTAKASGLCAMVLIAACTAEKTVADTAGDNAKKELAKPLDPVTVNMYLQAASYWTEEDFAKAIAEPVKKKYPHITVNRIVKDLPTALAAGETADLYVSWTGPMVTVKDYDFFMDMTPLIKKHNFDLGRIDASALEMARLISDSGKELYALPYTTHASGLYYNKAIFDKFGVAYPPDGMTWDDAIALGVKLNRQDGGVQYYGLGTDSFSRITFQKSLALVDPKTEKANVNSDPYRLTLETFKKIFASQGLTRSLGSNETFLKTQNVAMWANVNIWTALRTANMNWDVAQYPSFPGQPNVYGMHDLHYVAMNKHSKHQDDAMRVIEMMFTDQLHEYLVTTVGRFSTMADPKFNLMFGKSHPEFQGKRLTSMMKSHPAPAAAFSRYYEKATSILNGKMPAYLNNEVDINTMLRQAEEEINQYISTQKK